MKSASVQGAWRQGAGRWDAGEGAIGQASEGGDETCRVGELPGREPGGGPLMAKDLEVGKHSEYLRNQSINKQAAGSVGKKGAR